jgi:uncharacterized protein (TIGR00661 family)
MNVLYGVCGEGMGHAMRSHVVAQHLASRGHDVRFVSSGSAHRYLAERWPGRVSYALGLRTVLEKNRIQPMATLLSNVTKQTFGPLMHAASFISIASGGRPDVVVSDFDPWVSNYARFLGIPVVAVDNVHFMNRCSHPSSIIASDRTAAAMMFPTVSRMVPAARRYLVTTFVGAPVIKGETTLHFPILRPSILAASPSAGDHVTVYFNENADHASIAGVLQQVDAPFVVYGFRGLTHDVSMGNVTFRAFSEPRFIGDMASSRAVVGGAGFTLMTEAIYLGKPMLAAAFEGQFEQILNANYLEYVGYGQRARTLDVPTVRTFLGRLPLYHARLAGFRHDRNVGLLQAVDAAIAEIR